MRLMLCNTVLRYFVTTVGEARMSPESHNLRISAGKVCTSCFDRPWPRQQFLLFYNNKLQHLIAKKKRTLASTHYIILYGTTSNLFDTQLHAGKRTTDTPIYLLPRSTINNQQSTIRLSSLLNEASFRISSNSKVWSQGYLRKTIWGLPGWTIISTILKHISSHVCFRYTDSDT